MGGVEKQFIVYDVATGLYIKKNPKYSGYSWVESDRATRWKSVGHLKNSLDHGVLRNVLRKKDLRVVELDVQTVVVSSKNYPLSELP